MAIKPNKKAIPQILAPAGNKESFLAALAAGADAVYCGLKQFSARMEANNFTIEELAALAKLARKKDVKVYVTLNSLVKADEIEHAGRLVEQLSRIVKPDALIIQDLAFVELAGKIGYQGELHLSTLANVSFPSALKDIDSRLGINRVVTPRELTIDEIRQMAEVCPENMSLEVFVHGALCYGVSGRCYWSSFLGGRSGLRGRCVQPCRRLYLQKDQKKRFFSCQDFSIDVLAKLLLSISKISAWKIEGRKKGPHYVFYTVTAYRLLRDHLIDPKESASTVKRRALDYLEQAFGRKGTHYNLLSHRIQTPINTDLQTGSGFLVGHVKGSFSQSYLVTREKLMAGDLLRVGYEDEPGHQIIRVGKYIPKKGRLFIKLKSRKKDSGGIPVFLLDRREKELKEMISALDEELRQISIPKISSFQFSSKLKSSPKRKIKNLELKVSRLPIRRKNRDVVGFWLPNNLDDLSLKGMKTDDWSWLPPVIWPDEEKEIAEVIKLVLKKGYRNFVLNAPWQISFFNRKKGLNLWAGPFCNQANLMSISRLSAMGFKGVIVSPELEKQDFTILGRQSPLPLGIVISGNWPLCISRTISEDFNTGQTFKSPKGEQAWVKKYGENYWIYPNWTIDLNSKKNYLQKAGYSFFVHLMEPLPRQVVIKKRPGMWNWDIKMQ